MIVGIEYINRSTANFKELVDGIHKPVYLENGGFMLCKSGESEIIIDTKHYSISKGDIVVAFPYSAVRLVHASEHFEGVIAAVNIDFFANIQLSNKGNYFAAIKDSPAISLTENESANLLKLISLLEEESADTQHPMRTEIDLSIFKIITYKIVAIYSRRETIREESSVRDNSIFNTFVIQIFERFKLHHTLEYYAQNQMITPSHLSRAVKRASGRTAKEWLVECMILNIKAQLQNSSKPINIIADEFNFANASFFSQYFKKYSGKTPQEYRAGFESQYNTL